MLSSFPLKKTLFWIFITICILSILINLVEQFDYLLKPLSFFGSEQSEVSVLNEELKLVGNIPNFNLHFGDNNMTKLESSVGGVKCAQRPKWQEIEFSNTHWQILRLAGEHTTIMFLYSAHVDTRLENQTLARIILSSDVFLHDYMDKPKFCQFWYDGHPEPMISEVVSIQHIWGLDTNGRYHPFLVTCNIFYSPIAPLPSSVSLVESACDQAYNDLKLDYIHNPEKKDFGICIRGLDFPTEDLSIRLIEWIEMMRILGAQGIHFHLLSVHYNVIKVLEYYEKLGFVTTKNFSLPGYQANLPVMRNKYTYYPANVGFKMWRQEVIPYNDCFLKYMSTYKYIAIVDIDEVILPKNDKNWNDLIKTVNPAPDRPAVCFEMILFVDKITHNGVPIKIAPNITNQIPYYPYMMNKLNYELKTVCNGGGQRGAKCLHNTANVLMLHNHFPRGCIETEKKCSSLRVNSTVGYVHHHKESCWKDPHNETILEQPFGFDDSIFRFANELIQRRNQVLKNMDF